jgi:hypothetical protein
MEGSTNLGVYDCMLPAIIVYRMHSVPCCPTVDRPICFAECTESNERSTLSTISSMSLSQSESPVQAVPTVYLEYMYASHDRTVLIETTRTA